MNSIIKKTLLGLVVAQCLLFSPISLQPARAQVDLWGENNVATNAFNNVGFKKQDPRVIIANVIKIALGFLGTIAVVLIIFAGFLWMTAGGKQDQIGKATDIMKNAVIGLIIIMASYGITLFITGSLTNALQ